LNAALSSTAQLPGQSAAEGTSAHRLDMPAPAIPNEAELRARRHVRALARQRQRRKTQWRVDYAPSAKAEAIVHRLAEITAESVPAILDRIITEWAAFRKL
jgi:hypothetical protein